MTVSQSGIDLIKEFEGCRLEAYQDGAGIWTIGYGHIQAVKPGDTCTQEEADDWLNYDLDWAVLAVSRYVEVPVGQNQFDALVSFTFNLGVRSLRESSLLRLLNSGKDSLTALEFPKWDKVAGEASPGLLKRRNAEMQMFLGVAPSVVS